MDMRELKGLEIAARSRISFKDGAWVVPSQSGKGTYRVVLSPQGDSCPCDDFQLTQKPCKHVHAARLVQERDHGGKAPTLDFDAVPKRKTYAQPWAAYNLAQNIEKHRFQELLADLCRGVEEPTAGRHASAADRRTFSAIASFRPPSKSTAPSRLADFSATWTTPVSKAT